MNNMQQGVAVAISNRLGLDIQASWRQTVTFGCRTGGGDVGALMIDIDPESGRATKIRVAPTVRAFLVAGGNGENLVTP